MTEWGRNQVSNRQKGYHKQAYSSHPNVGDQAGAAQHGKNPCGSRKDNMDLV